MFAKREEIQAVGNLFPNIFIGIQIITALVNIAQFHGRTDVDAAAIRSFLAGNQLEQSGFTRAIWPDNTHNTARRQIKVQIIEQQFIAIGLGQALSFNNLAAQTGRCLNKNLRLAGVAVFLCFHQLVKAFNPRF